MVNIAVRQSKPSSVKYIIVFSLLLLHRNFFFTLPPPVPFLLALAHIFQASKNPLRLPKQYALLVLLIIILPLLLEITEKKTK